MRRSRAIVVALALFVLGATPASADPSFPGRYGAMKSAPPGVRGVQGVATLPATGADSRVPLTLLGTGIFGAGVILLRRPVRLPGS